tara:strand:+ start:886 stop:1515 length:630 start_codon:yes stop_codon:yes gene_type:complete
MIAMRRQNDALLPIIFFLIVAALFPLGVSPEIETLSKIGPGIIWVGALLASILALEQLFLADFRDGTLEQMLITSNPLWLIITSKVFTHWLITGLPLVIISPILALQYNMNLEEIKIMLFSLILGTPTLSFLGAIGASLTLGLRSSGALIALLVLPLYIPVLIFGAGAIEVVSSGIESGSNLKMLGAILIGACIFSPAIIASALRISAE